MLTRFALPDSFDTSTSTSAHIPPRNLLSGRWNSIVRARGTTSPSTINPSIWHSMASMALVSASSVVAPAEKQPGKSGTVTP